ncbi:hypothetical protein DFJ74DRAFT_455158 [Hyaloraphidium curvatum]|nr:hypothetical protein DFJ74DRAFT_455158 [Hyaloraphidium curvatum]
MLLALRCLSNLIEALPSATALVVGAEGVPALVAKLREIEYIDLAESVLSVLGKVAGEYPLAVLRAGGVAAALGYVDFFALSTQRVAVGIAAAALRGLGQQAGAEDMAREAMPTLERLLGYGDARLVEGVVKAIAKVVEWACRPQAGESEKAVEDRVESLIQSSLLRAIMDLLSPNVPTQTVVTPQLFTSLLRLLPPVLRASPRYAHMMAAEWGLADLVRSVLCGPEPADAADEVADAEDANAGTAERVMRTIATRTEEQVIEALSVATDAIAALPKGDIWALRVPAGQGDEKAKPPRASTSESQASDVAMEGAEAPAASSESKPEGEDPADGGDGEEDGDGEGDDGEEDEEDDDEPPSPTTTTGPSFTERNAKLAELHRADKDSLVNFCGSLLPVVLEVHAATVQPQIRRKCVGLIARMVWFCGEIAGEDGLRIVLARAKGFGGFVTSLVVQGREGVYGAAIDANAPPSVAAAAAASEANKKAEQLGVLASGLQLALLVLERCPDPYLRAFVREGVLHEVEKTAQVATAWLEEHQQAAADAAASAEASKDAAGDVVMADADGGSGSNSGPRRSKRNKGKESEPASGSASAAASPKPASAAKPSSAPQPTSSSSSSAEPGSTASLLSGMRKMLERLSDVMGHSGTDLGAVAASAGIPGLAPPPPRTGSAPMVQNISGERFADKDVREWLVWMCSRILAFYSDVSTKSSGEVGSVLRELKALSKKLKAAAAMSEGGSDPADIASLHRVAELLAGVGVGGDGKGATSFEVLRSGIVEGLVQYLSALPLADSKSAAAMSPEDARAQHLRIKAFVHVFMNGPWPYPGDRELTVVSVPHEDPRGDSDRRHQHGPGPQPLRSSHDHTEPQMYVPNALMSLVRRLQSLLSRTEHFEVVAAIPGQQSSALASYALESIMGASYLAASQNPAMQLTRQLRLRLVAEEPDNVPKTFNNYAVSIHAVATFRALEEYLKGRVGGLDFGSTPGQGDGTVASTGNPAASNASAAAADAAASPSAVVPSGGDDKASGAGDGDVEMDQGEDGEDDEDGEDGDDGDDGEDGEDDEDEDEDEDGEEEGAPGEAPSGGEGEEAGASGDYDDGEDDYDDGDYDDGQVWYRLSASLQSTSDWALADGRRERPPAALGGGEQAQAGQAQAGRQHWELHWGRCGGIPGHRRRTATAGPSADG